MSATSGACPAAWLKFLSALEGAGVNFDEIQYTGQKDRESVLDEVCANFSKIERAVVSSHWNKLTSAPGAAGTSAAAAAGGLSDAMSAASTSRGLVAAAPQGLARNGGVAPIGLASPMSPAARAAAVGGFLVMPDGIAFGPGSGTFDPAPLRAALTRGDATSALPMASEMLQRDPLALCAMLHDYAPHLSVTTIKSILGLDGGPPGRGLPAAIAATGDASPLRFGQHDANDVSGGRPGTPRTGGARSGPATMNGSPIPSGQVLTMQSLTGVYGAGFSISCNGQLLHLPYCVQSGDHILVAASEVRL